LNISSVVNYFSFVNSFVDVSSPKGKSLLQFRLEKMPYDLSGKALYLRSYEYWSPIINTVKDLRISISSCAE
jgi:hypothetical protein